MSGAIHEVKTIVPYERSNIGGKYEIKGVGVLHVYDKFVLFEALNRGRMTSNPLRNLHEILSKKEISDDDIEEIVRESVPLCAYEPCNNDECLYRNRFG